MALTVAELSVLWFWAQTRFFLTIMFPMLSIWMAWIFSLLLFSRNHSILNHQKTKIHLVLPSKKSSIYPSCTDLLNLGPPKFRTLLTNRDVEAGVLGCSGMSWIMGWSFIRVPYILLIKALLSSINVDILDLEKRNEILQCGWWDYNEILQFG